MYEMGMSMKLRGPEGEAQKAAFATSTSPFVMLVFVFHDPAFRPKDKARDGMDTGFQSAPGIRISRTLLDVGKGESG
jgi:hypothetical protein